jgi:hypothetical protein
LDRSPIWDTHLSVKLHPMGTALYYYLL